MPDSVPNRTPGWLLSILIYQSNLVCGIVSQEYMYGVHWNSMACIPKQNYNYGFCLSEYDHLVDTIHYTFFPIMHGGQCNGMRISQWLWISLIVCTISLDVLYYVFFRTWVPFWSYVILVWYHYILVWYQFVR